LALVSHLNTVNLPGLFCAMCVGGRSSGRALAQALSAPGAEDLNREGEEVQREGLDPWGELRSYTGDWESDQRVTRQRASRF
jgi:hypothetical protein